MMVLVFKQRLYQQIAVYMTCKLFINIWRLAKVTVFMIVLVNNILQSPVPSELIHALLT